MKRPEVVIPWEGGLHLRPAAEPIRRSRDLCSRIRLRANEKGADTCSVLSLPVLCTSMRTVVEVEIDGADEASTMVAVEGFFGTATDCAGEFADPHDTLP